MPIKRFQSICIPVLLGMLMICALFTSCTTEKKPIKIAAIISLSGAGSHLLGLTNAMQMAVEEVNAAGGINGRKIRLIVEDNRTRTDAAIKSFEKIEAEHKPDVYISALSRISHAISPLAENAQAPLIALVAGAPNLTRNKQWVFRFFATVKDEVPPIMSILKMQNINKLGIIYLTDEYGRSCYDLINKRFSAAEKIVRSSAFQSHHRDFGKIIDQIMDTEAVYVIGYVIHTAEIYRQLRTKNYKGIILGASPAANSRVKTLPEADGTYLAAPAIFNQQYMLAHELNNKYTARYQSTLNQQEATGYDVIKLLSGLLDGEEINRSNVKKVLEQGFSFPSTMGDIIVKPGSHEINFKLFPARIRNGQINYRHY